jgi:DNA polymerase-3 subunit beta
MATATATKERRKNGSGGITSSVGDLLDALQDVMRAVPTHGPKPVLTNVRIGNGLITGTDLEVMIDRHIDGDCEPFLVPAARLLQILRACPRTAEVTLTPSASRVTVQAGGGRWELPTEDVNEFPAWEVTGAKPIARLPSDQFARAVRATEYACDADSSRYALGCVLVEVKDGNPTFVATDGRRLTAVETETDQAVDDSTTQVPARAIRLMAGFAHNSETGVQLEATASEVVCSVDRGTITARLIEGKFPRWRDVFPQRDVEATVVDVVELASATRAASVCTSEQSKGVEFTFFSAGIRLRSQSAEAGQAEVTCDVITAGKPAVVKLDPRFVLDFLGGLSTDDEPHVEIEADKPGDAVLLRCGDVRGIIMPLAE